MWPCEADIGERRLRLFLFPRGLKLPLSLKPLFQRCFSSTLISVAVYPVSSTLLHERDRNAKLSPRRCVVARERY